MDTGLIWRLRQVLALPESRLVTLLGAMAGLADPHAAPPMAARTYGRIATLTRFGAVVARWGRPLLRLHDRLADLRPSLLVVQPGGASGTPSVMGDQGPRIHADLARALGLADPGASWHAERDPIAELAGWLTALTAGLGKIGADVILPTRSGMAEVGLARGGASSTVPQTMNPVAALVLVALARHAGVLNTRQAATLHRQQRDGGGLVCPMAGAAPSFAVRRARRWRTHLCCCGMMGRMVASPPGADAFPSATIHPSLPDQRETTVKFLDPNHPFFASPLRRWLTSLLPIAWGAVELYLNSPGWAVLFIAAGVYAGYILLWKR